MLAALTYHDLSSPGVQLDKLQGHKPGRLGDNGQRGRSWDTALAPFWLAAVLDAAPVFWGGHSLHLAFTPLLLAKAVAHCPAGSPSTQPGAEISFPAADSVLYQAPAALLPRAPPAIQGTPQSSTSRTEV